MLNAGKETCSGYLIDSSQNSVTKVLSTAFLPQASQLFRDTMAVQKLTLAVRPRGKQPHHHPHMLQSLTKTQANQSRNSLRKSPYQTMVLLPNSTIDWPSKPAHPFTAFASPKAAMGPSSPITKISPSTLLGCGSRARYTSKTWDRK